MDIARITLFGIVASVVAVLLRNEKPEISMQLSLAAGIAIFLMMLGKLTLIVETLQELARRMDIDSTYLYIIVKIIGIAYLASFGIEICNDAGMSSIGSKIELAAKIFIIILALPVMLAVMDMIVRILP